MVATDLVTNHSAVADGKWYHGAWTIFAGDNLLTAPAAAPDFVLGDEGKSIMVGNAGGPGPQGGSPLVTTILTYIGPTQVRLAANAGYSVPNTDITNIIVSWGTNNSAAFESYNNTYRGQTGVVLTIPAGTYHVGANDGLFRHVKEQTVEAAGATIAGGSFALGAGAQYLVISISGDVHANTATVSAGATSITCLTPAEASRFTVGKYALMTGISLQYGGYPTNHYFFDWVLVSAVNTTTGVVTFATTPLTHTYKSTWPEIKPLDSGVEIYYGGPATLYAWWNDILQVGPVIYGDPGNFEHTCVINSLTIAHHAQFPVRGLDITLNNCVFHGDFGPYPTMTHTCRMNNCVALGGNMEIDKYITNFYMTDCEWNVLNNQSGNENSVYDGVEVHYTIVGTGKNTVYRNCNIGAASPTANITMGTQYGAVNSIVIEDSVVANIDSACNGIVIPGGTGLTGVDVPPSYGVQIDFDMADGVISIPRSWLPYQTLTTWLVPNTYLSWLDAGRGILGWWKILDITSDTDTIYVTTTWPGTFPPGPYYDNKLWIGRHAAPIATFSNVTGCARAIDLSANHVPGYPVNSRTKRQYTNSIVSTPYDNTLSGRVVEMTIDVLTAYSGGSGGPITATPGFSNYSIKMSDFTLWNRNPTIDLRVTGTRRWTLAGGWTSTAVGASDTLPVIGEPIAATAVAYMTMVDISGESTGLPTFTHEVKVDQGFRSRTFTCTFGEAEEAPPLSRMAGGLMVISDVSREAYVDGVMVNL